MFAGYPESKQAKQMVLAFFGHEIDDKDLLAVFKEKAQNSRKPTIISKVKMFFGMIYMLLFSPRIMMKTKADYIENRKYDLVQELVHFSSCKQIFDYLMNSFNKDHGRNQKSRTRLFRILNKKHVFEVCVRKRSKYVYFAIYWV